MIPEPGSDAHDLAAATRRWLSRSCGSDVIREAIKDSGPDAEWRPSLWQGVVDLGLTGIMTPEAMGGSGAGPVELGAAMEELGRALYPGPFLSSVVLAGLAAACSRPNQAVEALLRDLATGTTATLASGPDPQSTPLEADLRDGLWQVSGTAPAVVDAPTAERVLAIARTSSGLGLFEVEEVDRTPLTAMDHTRPLGALTFAAAPAVPLAEPAQLTERCLQRAHDLACLLLAAEQLGGASTVLEMAVDHARRRHQFGRPIGSFQAVKHRCVDMLLEVESARSVVWHGLRTAAAVLDGKADDDALALVASLARAVASDAYLFVASGNIQVYGGIGFTWEHDAHLHVKRARGSQLLLGSPTSQRTRLLPLVLADARSSTPSAADAGPVDPDVEAFLAEVPPATTADRELRERRYDAGLAMAHFEPGYGGRGWPSARQSSTESAFVRAGAEDWTSRNVIGLGMAMATIHAHGTEEQKRFHLRPCFTGEHIWCQLFSEPGAGSDLAGVATMAVPDGDDFVVTGQKVWTSLGHVAHYGLLLARTDPAVAKHRGLTYFLLDMSLPGIEVRPLRQLTGEAEFNEVHLDGVRVPGSAVLGGVGHGWRVAMTTLMNERVAIGGSGLARHGGPIGQAISAFEAAQVRGVAGPVEAERLMQLWSHGEAARLTNQRAWRRPEPGPEGSLAKLQMAEGNQATYDFCVELAGTDGMFVDTYDLGDGARSAVFGGADVRKAWLRSLANSIEGGTSEVLRNVLGERVLGLPQEPRLDRDVPWQQTARS